ncbi:MAG: DEAD/DEAH box helicase family protein, partial [Pirellulaceae bacterium]
GICEKPRVKCADCPHQRYLPLTDEVVRWHLSGQDDHGQEFVAGLYPLLLDESCQLLAIDLDGDGWADDARAVLDVCHRMGLAAALERSRSGRGGHIWWFFAAPVSAALARKLGSCILTETMEQRPELGFGSYDRFFPGQDTLPRGGLGNLIALPLQKGPRRFGHSVFVDDQLVPFPDQWAYLSAIPRIDRRVVERLVYAAGRQGRILGVRMARDEDADREFSAGESRAPSPSRRVGGRSLDGLVPRSIDLTLADQVYVPKARLPPELRNRLLRLAAFQNAEFYQAQAMRVSTYGKPRIISCAEEDERHIVLPRGCLDEVQTLLAELSVGVRVRDERFAGTPIGVEFQAELRPAQQTAADRLLAHDTGVLSAATAFGKTIVAAWLIAQRRVNTLVLVHRRQLVEQWIERLSLYLGLSRKEIGQIGGGRSCATGKLDVALIQSLVRRGSDLDRVQGYGQVLVDECHHVAARSFDRVVRRARAKYVAGFSATVTRQDGHHPVIFMQCGPVRYRLDEKAAAAEHPFAHTVHVRPTAFQPRGGVESDRRLQVNTLLRELAADDDRNRLICDDVLEAVREGRSPLVLTERKDHLEALARRLDGKVKHVILLHGGRGIREARRITSRLAEVGAARERVLLATGRYIGEGFDDSRLDTLFLALPVSWRGTIAQYVGRLHRLHGAKREVRVFDYADLNVPLLARMFDRRCVGYEAVGYRVWVPGSAVPGWPVEVALPVDPRWKLAYATSVQRLVRDGIDAPLARLFVGVAGPIESGATGAERARSATEAFLFRRLESLPETAGRFELNASLAIPFDGWGNMEVDLLCASARVVVELDGSQHLSSCEAYRRDRRKDMLLQEQGYFVMRFLTEDVGTQLDSVLDAILRAVARRAWAQFPASPAPSPPPRVAPISRPGGATLPQHVVGERVG